MAKKKAQPIPELAEEQVVLASLKKHPRNYKKHTDAQLEHIAHNIKREGVWKNVVVSKDGYTLAGHGVVEAAIRAGLKRAPARRIPVAHTHPRALAIVVADNETSRLAENDDMMLAALLGSIQEADGLLGTGYDDDALAALTAEAAPAEGGTGAGRLAEQFLVPPFSVLDARQGYWQDRKRAWLALGIKSELGRVAPIGGGPMPLDRQRGGGSLPANVGARDSHAQAHGRLRRRAET